MDFVNLWIVHYLVMADGGYVTHRGPTLVRWSIKSRFSRPNGSAIFGEILVVTGVSYQSLAVMDPFFRP
jgi:hypothetical protein